MTMIHPEAMQLQDRFDKNNSVCQGKKCDLCTQIKNVPKNLFSASGDQLFLRSGASQLCLLVDKAIKL